jgi:aspartyl-tRNA(Asn)/glutamyl-tRNA(Gln) amidotransferase subunit C
MTSVMPMTIKKRVDAVTEGGIAEDIVRNAPMSEDNYFVVPKVVE